MREGKFTPFLNADAGRYVKTRDYPDDGTTVDLNGGWGVQLGRGSLALFGEFLDRQKTNRACADSFLVDSRGSASPVECPVFQSSRSRSHLHNVLATRHHEHQTSASAYEHVQR